MTQQQQQPWRLTSLPRGPRGFEGQATGTGEVLPALPGRTWDALPGILLRRRCWPRAPTAHTRPPLQPEPSDVGEVLRDQMSISHADTPDPLGVGERRP